MRSRIWAIAGPLVVACLFVATVQRRAGAWSSDFSADPDEPSHVVSSLAVYDYLRNGLHQNPIAFAETYYLHYPKLAIGHWPPLFYCSEAAWMFAFGRNRAAMLSFAGFVAAALLTSIFYYAWREYGTAAAIVACLALLRMGLIQTELSQVAPNLLLALVAFWSAVAWGKYIEERKARDAVIAAILMAAAVGVHGRGVALLFLPSALLLIGRLRWTKLRVAILILIVLVTVTLPYRLHQANPFRLRGLFIKASHYPLHLGDVLGWPLLALAVIGAVVAIQQQDRHRHRVAMPALVISGWAFQSLINVGFSDRYLITIVPAAAILIAAGFNFCLSAIQRPVFRVACVVGISASLIATTFPFARKIDLGYHALRTATGRVDLIAAEPVHEGAFIAEADLRDPGLARFALRASKLLAFSSWNGEIYHTRFSGTAEAAKCLEEAHVERVLIQMADRQPHVLQLLDVVQSGPWREIHCEGAPPGIRVFERWSPLPAGYPAFTLDLRYTLGRALTYAATVTSSR